MIYAFVLANQQGTATDTQTIELQSLTLRTSFTENFSEVVP